MDGDGKYAKPVEDPQAAYNRRYAKLPVTRGVDANANAPSATPASMLTDMELVSCPKCGGRMWDNRLTKRNPRAPDYKCQNRSCDGVIWPLKTPLATAGSVDDSRDPKTSSTETVLIGGEDELPF